MTKNKSGMKMKYEPPKGAKRLTDFYGRTVRLTEDNPHAEGYVLGVRTLRLFDERTNQDKDCRYLFFIDEFGEICQIAESHTLKPAFDEIAQWSDSEEKQDKYIIMHLENTIDTGQPTPMKAIGAWLYDEKPDVDKTNAGD